MGYSNYTKWSQRAIRILLIAASIITLYPFYYVLIQSLSDPIFGSGAWIFPIKPFLMNYRIVFMTRGIGSAYLMTILRVASGVPIYLLVTGMTAFVFSRKELMGRKSLIWLYLIPMYFDGGFIAFYVWMRQIHLYNTFWMYILPACYGMWAMIVMKTAFKQIPESMIESAMMDGAGYFRTFVKIIFPLSLPMMATLGLFCAVTYWNDWTVGTFYMEDQSKWTLQTFLQLAVMRGKAAAGISFDTGNSSGGYNMMELNLSPQEQEKVLKLNSTSMETAFIMVSTLPIMAVYPFVQRYFVKGVMIGSIKE